MQHDHFSRSTSTALLLAALGLQLAGCGSDAVTTAWVAPTMPTAQSAIVPPPLTAACPIAASSIDTLVTKGTGLAFGGSTFGAVGTYNYILAEASALVSAKDPCAATIVDLKNAAAADGRVSYKFDVVILTPTDATKANGTLLYEVNNRTTNPVFTALHDGSSADIFNAVKPVIPAAATGVVLGTGSGNGFLMNQGITVVWSGWQGDRPQTLNVPTAAITATTKWYAAGMTLPTALDAANKNAQITGPVQDEFIADTATLTT